MKAWKSRNKMTVAIVGVLLLVGVSSVQALEVKVDASGTAYAILGLEVGSKAQPYDVEFVIDVWPNVYGLPTPVFDFPEGDVPFAVDAITAALNSAGVSSVGLENGTEDFGFYGIAGAEKNDLVSWQGASYQGSSWNESIAGEAFGGHQGQDQPWVWAKFTRAPTKRDEIIGTSSSGIFYWDLATSQESQMWNAPPDGDIAAGDFTDDGIADVASIWPGGLYYQDGDTLGWTKVSDTVYDSLTAGDVTGDGRSEIIYTSSSGIFYWNLATSQETQMYHRRPDGDIITAGDFTGDGIADVASIWRDELWYQDGASLEWKLVGGISSDPKSMTAGDVTGDFRDEIIVALVNGIWYWDGTKLPAEQWTQMTKSTPTGDITAGDFTFDGKADVASIWASGLWYQDGATLEWTKVSATVYDRLTAGDVTGD